MQDGIRAKRERPTLYSCLQFYTGLAVVMWLFLLPTTLFLFALLPADSESVLPEMEAWLCAFLCIWVPVSGYWMWRALYARHYVKAKAYCSSQISLTVLVIVLDVLIVP